MLIHEKQYEIEIPNDILKAYLADKDLLSSTMKEELKNGDLEVKFLSCVVFESDTKKATLKYFHKGFNVKHELSESDLNHELLNKLKTIQDPLFEDWIKENEPNEAFLLIQSNEIKFDNIKNSEALLLLLKEEELKQSLVENFIKDHFDPKNCEYVLNYKFKEEIVSKIMKEAPLEISTEYKNLYLDDLYEWDKILISGNFMKIIDLYNQAKHSESEMKYEVIQAVIKSNNTLKHDMQQQLLLFYYHDICNDCFSYDKNIAITQILSLRNCPYEVFEENLEFEGFQYEIIKNKYSPSSILKKISAICNSDLSIKIANHKNCPIDLKESILEKNVSINQIKNEIDPNIIKDYLEELHTLPYSDCEKIELLKSLISKPTCFPSVIERVFKQIHGIRCKDKELLQIILDNDNTNINIKKEIFSKISPNAQYGFLSNIKDTSAIIDFAKEEIKNIKLPLSKEIYSYSSLPHSLQTLFFTSVNKESLMYKDDSKKIKGEEFSSNLKFNKNLSNIDEKKIWNILKDKVVNEFRDLSVSKDPEAIFSLYNIINNDNVIFEHIELSDQDKSELTLLIKQNEFTPVSILREL